MKRNLLHPKRHLGSRVGTVLLAVSLLAGPGMASPASAVEPAPTSTARPTATATPAAKPSASPAPSPATPAQAAIAPAAAKATSADYRTAMAAAAGPGGAVMGQGLRGSAPSAPSRLRTTAEALATEGTWTPTFGVQGLDVSNYQATVNWQTQWDLGARFAYIKATEGNYYSSPAFRAQFQGSRGVGMLRGAYHFANPAASSGADQARIFVNAGGVWSPDGYTLPPALDFEANPYAGQTIGGYYQGNTCYDMSPTQLTTWVRDFGRTMLSLTGRLPVIYTNTSWWKRCTADATGFGDYPLWTAYWPSSASNYAGPIPAGWRNYSFWQYSESGPFAGDSNVWNGSYADLRTFAGNSVPRAALDAIAVFTSSSVMGSATSGISCGLRGGGCFQGFTKGVVMWSPATGAQPSLLGPIRDAWARSGYENGTMGYPTSGVICGLKNSGCFQNYQGGAIMWSPASGAALSPFGAIRNFWQQQNFENGPLGYPTSNPVCGLTGGGCFQNFQGGTVMWSPASGAQTIVPGQVRQVWERSGYEGGTLGYPTGKHQCNSITQQCSQTFQRGTAAWSSANGGWAIPGATATSTAWRPAEVGYPVSAQSCGLRAGGCFQNFQKGVIMYSPASGAFSLSGERLRLWQRTGFENGSLGYPTSGQTCGLKDQGCFQNFERASVLSSPATGTRAVYLGPFLSTWAGTGFEGGSLGYPTSDQFCGLRNGGCFQNFQKGSIMYSPTTGAQPITSALIRTAWAKTGYETGSLGYPTNKMICGLKYGGCFQNFEKGSIMWSPLSGAAPMLLGPIHTLWGQQGFENGPLGYPTSPQTCTTTNATCTQTFTGGKITWTPALGARIQPS